MGELRIRAQHILTSTPGAFRHEAQQLEGELHATYGYVIYLGLVSPYGRPPDGPFHMNLYKSTEGLNPHAKISAARLTAYRGADGRAMLIVEAADEDWNQLENWWEIVRTALDRRGQLVSANIIRERAMPMEPAIGDYLGGVRYWYEMKLGGYKVTWSAIAKLVRCHEATLKKYKQIFDAQHHEYNEQLERQWTQRRRKPRIALEENSL
jgi:hypothetical protein